MRRLYSGGTDFSDRPPEEVLFETLEEVGASGEDASDGGTTDGGEPEVRVSADEAERETVRPDKPALTLEELGPYYLGTYFATVAMQQKLEGEAREKVEGYQELVNEYNAAIRETDEQDSS